jgi:hypothetical protein
MRDRVDLTSKMDCELTALGKAVTCHVVTDGTDGSRVELTSVTPCHFIVAVLPTNHLFGHGTMMPCTTAQSGNTSTPLLPTIEFA